MHARTTTTTTTCSMHNNGVRRPVQKYQVAIIGSGNWGSAIAKVAGENVAQQPELFEPQVKMWMQNRDLADIVNTRHENTKYLPGIKLPTNVIAVPDLLATYVEETCRKLRGHLRPDAKAVSLIKGMSVEDGEPQLISELINGKLSPFSPKTQPTPGGSLLDIDVSVLCGANIASEVAKGGFSEATIGYKDRQAGEVWRKLFHNPTFRINTVDDVAGVEVCGALKNVVALGAGFCDGLGLSSNTKAAVIRCGLAEMRKFAQTFFSDINMQTFFESCGVADLIVTCFSGRNRKVSEAFVVTKKSFEALEKDILNGQKLQGTLTAQEAHEVLEKKGLTDEYESPSSFARFPLFRTIYQIAFEGLAPSHITAF
ncbi:glycerol-3-phosphate dehydrogenase (soluble) [Acanthamoeba castellanii str. Neff]|uniref:Glycerol-3-phosphate dehydrogenase [NAD(+)] n=1 Tax=Acanthamoeba castellanii (strain ATCC 30010 / Neff) TaxID=1257118 RepID=L8GQX6_ACACF|nr:glycerol-3-phosphate dehydrogenase (soluble) [Acanthamoeba castellanii str. Neff]ELR15400.1 glycerol-3-phosphate dehydrogenase (soluble) [Acanthamoeba castellanii str. Neff]